MNQEEYEAILLRYRLTGESRHKNCKHIFICKVAGTNCIGEYRQTFFDRGTCGCNAEFPYNTTKRQSIVKNPKPIPYN